MKYHKQEILWKVTDLRPTGTCYPTCLACLMDLELNQVPNFNLIYFTSQIDKDNLEKLRKYRYLHGKTLEEAESYQKSNHCECISMQYNLWNMVKEYFLASYGLFERYIGNIDKFIEENPDKPYMIHGTSLREVSHVVIGMNGKFLHDPHPSNSFIKSSIDNTTDKWSYTYLDKIEDYHIDKYIGKLKD